MRKGSITATILTTRVFLRVISHAKFSGNLTSARLAHQKGTLSPQNPPFSTPGNEVRCYRITSLSSNATFQLLQTLTLSWSEPEHNWTDVLFWFFFFFSVCPSPHCQSILTQTQDVIFNIQNRQWLNLLLLGLNIQGFCLHKISPGVWVFQAKRTIWKDQSAQAGFQSPWA